jgi:hypothetical protein
MRIIETRELERLVRETFPARHFFSAATELGLQAGRSVVTFVHGSRPVPRPRIRCLAWRGENIAAISCSAALSRQLLRPAITAVNAPLARAIARCRLAAESARARGVPGDSPRLLARHSDLAGVQARAQADPERLHNAVDRVRARVTAHGRA